MGGTDRRRGRPPAHPDSEIADDHGALCRRGPAPALGAELDYSPIGSFEEAESHGANIDAGQMSWAFVLESADETSTRFITGSLGANDRLALGLMLKVWHPLGFGDLRGAERPAV